MTLQVSHLRNMFIGDNGVRDLSFQLGESQVLSLLGPSGCGKSTSLRCIAGLVKPQSGTITLDGRTLFDGGSKVNLPPRQRDMGMVFQSYAVWPHMTVFDNVAYPLRRRHVARAEIRRRVGEVLELLDIQRHEKRGVGFLSGGEQQRVSLARAIVARPKVVLYDEPLSSLDRQMRTQLRRDIRDLHRQMGISAIYVTHDKEEALYLSDSIAVMARGQVRQVGTPDEIYGNPRDRFVAGVMGFENVIMATDVADDGANVSFEVAPGARVAARKRGEYVANDLEGFAIRSAAVHFASARHGSADAFGARPGSVLTGTVTSVGFLGESFEISVAAGEAKLTARVSAAEWASAALGDLTAGDRVELFLPIDEVVPLRKKGEAVTSFDASTAAPELAVVSA
ncbi:MAG: ABC transporter ATP-binding protein [Microbacterium sp.]|nr:MAG: ABC transporter ATP-binding protein [Microbacterium sp.]